MSRNSRERQQRQQTLLMLLGVQATIMGEENPVNTQPDVPVTPFDTKSKVPVTPFLDARKSQEKSYGNNPRHDNGSSSKPGKSKHQHR